MDELKRVKKNIEKIRESNPLVMNITNLVVTNITANALLAIGASPVMAFEKMEMVDMVSISQSLVINIGTLTKDVVESMFLAMKKANEISIPIVFDPVGVGATDYRNEISEKILNDFKIDIVRGNASEISNLVGAKVKTKGVDAYGHIDNIVEFANGLANRCGCVVCVSGAKDVITNGKKTVYVLNGDIALTKITGSGCISTAIIGAFAAVDNDFFSASLSGALIVGIAGELASKSCKGLGSFQVSLFDNLSIFDETYLENARINIV